MKLEFYSQLQLNNNHLYLFWTEIIDLLLLCLALKCERTRGFLLHLPNIIIYYIDTDEIPGFLLLLKNHILTARSEDTIFIFNV